MKTSVSLRYFVSYYLLEIPSDFNFNQTHSSLISFTFLITLTAFSILFLRLKFRFQKSQVSFWNYFYKDKENFGLNMTAFDQFIC